MLHESLGGGGNEGNVLSKHVRNKGERWDAKFDLMKMSQHGKGGGESNIQNDLNIPLTYAVHPVLRSGEMWGGGEKFVCVLCVVRDYAPCGGFTVFERALY